MKLEIIGHRGASFDAPENTIPAAQLAFEGGADGIEIDIRMTDDNKIIVFHDETASRLSNSNKKVANSTLEQLKTIDIGERKGQQWKGTTIATLQEMLAAIPPNKKVFVEFKCGVDAIYELKNVLEASNRIQDVVIVSFDIKVLKLSKKELPNVAVYWIHDLPELDAYLTEWVIEKSLQEGFNGLMFSESAVDEDVVQFAQEKGLAVYSWTVNSPKVARKFARWGVNGVITDRPGWLKNQLRLTIAM